MGQSNYRRLSSSGKNKPAAYFCRTPELLGNRDRLETHFMHAMEMLWLTWMGSNHSDVSQNGDTFIGNQGLCNSFSSVIVICIVYSCTHIRSKVFPLSMYISGPKVILPISLQQRFCFESNLKVIHIQHNDKHNISYTSHEWITFCKWRVIIWITAGVGYRQSCVYVTWSWLSGKLGSATVKGTCVLSCVDWSISLNRFELEAGNAEGHDTEHQQTCKWTTHVF